MKEKEKNPAKKLFIYLHIYAYTCIYTHAHIRVKPFSIKVI